MSHTHNHDIKSYNKAFAIGILLNLGFVLVEAAYGVFADSLALIADAGHNLSDVVSLLLAWIAGILARRPATERRTYGLRKATVMASLASAILLLIALGGIAWEALGRFYDPKPVAGMPVIVVAAIGVVINAATALLFMQGQKHDLNLRAAFLHMTADAGISLGVVIAGVIILFKGWLWIDPALSLFIVLVVLVGTWRLLRDSVDYAMDAVPGNIDIQAIRHYLSGLDRVRHLHDLHVWPLSTTEVALTVHLVVDDAMLDNFFVSDIQQRLHDEFDIEHATIQVETALTESRCLLS
ncbi:MAG: cation transporter [Gammaproteobacteria bacterium]|nr:cation transporter [Gammaproteobacteria bacterium]